MNARIPIHVRADTPADKPAVAVADALREHWYVACASSQLGNEPRTVQLFDEPLVLFRDHQGKAGALEDRCCHRGVQLSLGTVTSAGFIACGYHGWQYDAAGRCVHVPSLCAGVAVPEGFRVRSYPCVEQDHYVWVWMGEGSPTTAAPSALRGVGEHGWTQGMVNATCSADRLIDNILDSSHVPFVHIGSHWSYFLNKMFGFKNFEYEVVVTNTGLAVVYPPAETPEQNFLGDHVASYLEFAVPDRVYVFQRGVKSGFYLILHMVREGERATRIEWLMQRMDRAPGIEWVGDENLTLHQDRALLERAEINCEREGTAFERHVPADFPSLHARRVIELLRRGEWESRKHELVQRKRVLVRQ